MSVIYQALRRLQKRDDRTVPPAINPTQPLRFPGIDSATPERPKRSVIVVSLLLLSGLGAVGGYLIIPRLLPHSPAPPAKTAAVHPKVATATALPGATVVTPPHSATAAPHPAATDDPRDTASPPTPAATEPATPATPEPAAPATASPAAPVTPEPAAPAIPEPAAPATTEPAAPSTAEPAAPATAEPAAPATAEPAVPATAATPDGPEATPAASTAPSEAAELALRKAKEREFRSHATRARQAIFANDPRGVEQELAAMVKLKGGSNLYVSNLRAFWLITRGDLAGAEPLLKQVLAKKPTDLEAGVNLAVVELESGRVDQAWLRLQELDQRHPDQPQVRELLAVIAQRRR